AEAPLKTLVPWGTPRVRAALALQPAEGTNGRQSSNRQPHKTNPRLYPDTKRPLSDRHRGGWLLPALIIGIMVAGVAIFAFENHMPTATSPSPDAPWAEFASTRQHS